MILLGDGPNEEGKNLMERKNMMGRRKILRGIKEERGEE